MNKKMFKDKNKFCEVHGHHKKYFCKSSSCMVDLCKLCLVFHEELHQEQGVSSQIEALENVIDESKEKLTKMMWIYEKEIKRLERAQSKRDQDWDQMVFEVEEKLRQNRSIVENVLEAYFKELQNQLMQNYVYPAKKLAMDSLSSPIKKLQLKKERLEQIQQNLVREKYENEIIRQVLSKNESATEKDLNFKVDEIICKEIIVPDAKKINISLNKEKLSKLYSSLQEFILVNVNLKELLTDGSSRLHNTDFVSQFEEKNSQANDSD